MKEVVFILTLVALFLCITIIVGIVIFKLIEHYYGWKGDIFLFGLPIGGLVSALVYKWASKKFGLFHKAK